MSLQRNKLLIATNGFANQLLERKVLQASKSASFNYSTELKTYI